MALKIHETEIAQRFRDDFGEWCDQHLGCSYPALSVPEMINRLVNAREAMAIDLALFFAPWSAIGCDMYPAEMFELGPKILETVDNYLAEKYGCAPGNAARHWATHVIDKPATVLAMTLWSNGSGEKSAKLANGSLTRWEKLSPEERTAEEESLAAKVEAKRAGTHPEKDQPGTEEFIKELRNM